MNIRFGLLLLYFVSIVSTQSCAEWVVVGKVDDPQGEFRLAREKTSTATTLMVSLNQAPSAVWTKTGQNSSDGSCPLDYWGIIDGFAQGSEVSVLLSMDSGLFWVKATQVNGHWGVDFEQEIHGAASFELKTTGIKLQNVSTVIVTDATGAVASYTRNTSGQLLRDGVLFDGRRPGTIITVGKRNEAQEVEARYGFTETSNYATLLSVLQRSFADHLANPMDKGAMGASMLVFTYASAADRVRLHAEFGLIQSDPSFRLKASRVISEFLQQGGDFDQPLKQQVSDRLWNQLKIVAGEGRQVREFIAHATDALLLLKDSRALDAVLANKGEIASMKATDAWSSSTDAATFRQLEQRYRVPSDGSQADIRRAEVYRLLAARKDAGLALEPSAEVQNLTQILE